MRLTREKSIRLSHVITDLLVASDDVEFVEDRDTIRQKVLQILQDLLKEEEAMDAEVRKKSARRKRKFWKEAKSGTCSTASIMRKRCAAWGLFTSRVRRRALSSPGFSLWIFVLGKFKPRRLKPALLKLKTQFGLVPSSVRFLSTGRSGSESSPEPPACGC